MDFEVVGQIVKIESIAIGHGIRELQNLKRLFGDAHWRKLKGEARIKLPSGHVRLAEIHWYEAHGIGRRKLKIKRFLD
jgi:hypothetical protein